RIGRSVAFIVLLESTGAMIAVTLCVQLLLHQWPLSLLLGAISAATAPAATVMVIQEMRAGGVLTSTLLAVVGIDDAIALILYGFAAAVAKALLTAEAAFSVSAIAGGAAFEIGGAILLGGLSGVLLARWLRRLESTEALFSVLIGAMLLILGIARQFGLSPLLANMALGIALANTCPMPSERIFNHVSLFAAPLLIAFFVVAGAHLRIDLLFSLGLLSLVYLLARMAGKVSGAFLGAALGGAAPEVRRYIGFGLLSQVGIAIGLSLVVAGEFAPLGEEGRHIALIVINVLLATTVVTEIVGPILTRYALVKAGEAGQAERFRP
ncbi:MAG: cation:proton antiporter, partial [Gammaproteobacteria bacterium]